jgi:hypothetical protein
VSNYKPPSIPPIQNIADAPTKNALLALTEGWQVRNGMTGSGENRFIDKAEFDAAMKALGVVAPAIIQDTPGSYAGGSSTSPSSTFTASSSGIDLLPLNNWWTGRHTWDSPFPVNTTADNWHIKLATAGLARWNFALGHPVITGAGNILPIGTWNSPSDTTDYMFLLNAARSSPSYAGHVALAFLPASDPEGKGIVINGMARIEGSLKVSTSVQDCIRINGSYNTASTYLGDHMTLDLNLATVAAFNQSDPNKYLRQSVQYRYNDIVKTILDFGASINSIRADIISHTNTLASHTGTLASHTSQLAGLGAAFTNDLNLRFTNIENRLTAGGL